MTMAALPAAVAAVALTPPQVFAQACQVASKKASLSAAATMILGFSAGALIGVGALLMTAVGACSPGLAKSDFGLDMFLKGAVGLPAGLTLVVLTGAELFTSNIFVMLAGVLQGTVKARALARNWVLSYFGNFVGSVFLARLSLSAHTLSLEQQVNAAKAIAHLKVSLPFGVALTKGVLCNWLVCLAVWGALASPTISGKVLAIFWPIATFVALGFEHCVANMYLIPQGMLAGADISVSQFLGNILPVTLGNIIGAAVFVAGVHWMAFGTAVTAEADEESDTYQDSCEEAFEDVPAGKRRTRGVALEGAGFPGGPPPRFEEGLAENRAAMWQQLSPPCPPPHGMAPPLYHPQPQRNAMPGYFHSGLA
uniref:Formate/nitrite transporter n=1 Tax=Zooxanthella nutricula TaxID=1333877 RepID=A0A6U9D0Y9_9DINO